MKTLEVISSNPSNEGRTHVTKLFAESTVETAFGAKTKKETYYVSGTKQLAIGSKVEIDLNSWNVVERPFELNGEQIMCKWLHLSDSQPIAKVISVKEQSVSK